MRSFTCFIVSLLIFGCAALVQAQLNRDKPNAVKDIGIDEKLGEDLPADIRLVNAKGDTVLVKELLNKGKPILLNPGYYQCPQLCSLIRTGVFNATREISWDPGEDYTILSFTIDHREPYSLADSVKNHYMNKFDREKVSDGWYFMTGSREEIQRLTRAVGFGFKYDKSRDQYGHQAAVIFTSPAGKITRYLYGIDYEPLDVKNALYESANGNIGNTIDKIVLSCYQYNPEKGSYVPVAWRIMKVGGIATMILLGGFLTVLWVKDRVKNKRKV